MHFRNPPSTNAVLWAGAIDSALADKVLPTLPEWLRARIRKHGRANRAFALPAEIKRAREKGDPRLAAHTETCDDLSWSAGLSELKWAHSEGGFPLGEYVCANAAKRGDTEMLVWAHENGAPWDMWTCIHAETRGDMEMFWWARANGAPWDEERHQAWQLWESRHLT